MLVISIVVISGCTQEESSSTPTPPITPVTSGYVQGYDHKLGYGFDYPEDWEMQVPDFGPPYENIEVFTKKDDSTQIKVSVKLTNHKSLTEVKAFGYVSQESILEEKFVDMKGKEAYEVVFKQLVAVDPNVYDKTKWVIFLANSMEYKIECCAAENMYGEHEYIFDHVINSFNIE